MHIFNKTFRVLREKKKAQGIMGQEIVDSCKRWLPSHLDRKTRIQVGSDSLLLPKHVSKGISWIFLVSSFFVFSLFFS